MKSMPRYQSNAAALVGFGISAASASGVGRKTSSLRVGFPSTTFADEEEEEGNNACSRGWAPTCQDDPNYVSKFGLSCEEHGFFQCELFLDLDFSPQEVSDLITSCPCSCNINCSDDSWKAAIGLDGLNQQGETTTDALLHVEESSTFSTAHPTQYQTGSPTTAPTTASPTDLPTTLMPSSTPTNKPSFLSTTTSPTKSPSSMPTQYDNATKSAETTGFSTQKGEARGTIPNVGRDGESAALQAIQDESPGSNSGSTTLSLMGLILVCVGMVAITLTSFVALYHRRSKADHKEKVHVTRKLAVHVYDKKDKKKGKRSGGHKKSDKRTIKRIVRRLGVRDDPSMSSRVIREDAAVVIAPSTHSRRNHEVLLMTT